MIGVRLGPWIIEQEIGRGGMGAVYRAARAADAALGPPSAAIKVLAAELAVEVGFQQRFQREIDILRQLDHPAIVRLFDSGRDQERYWFAMEFIDGPSYEEMRDARGRIPWPDVLELAWQIAPALKHAHDRGVIHRDLKPSNLLYCEADRRSRLTDFGIASLFASPHLTVTGGVIGTPEFLSPEQAAGKQITKKSDLYSLGVVLYTLVTGNTPFTGDAVSLLHKHRFGQFEQPRRLVPDLHPDLDEIICELLAKEPGDRPGDAGVLARRLDSLRKKIQRQERSERAQSASETTTDIPREGPATMVSRIVREELNDLNRPGPIGRVLNNPVVLVVLFLLCVGTLTWTFWPTSAKSLYERGSALMVSDNPADWDRAWADYLEPLEEKFPDHEYQEELAQLKQQYDELKSERAAAQAARTKSALGEGHWFFERGMRLKRQGKEKEAREVWQALIDAYADVPAEKPWVRKAERELGRKEGMQEDHLKSLRDALRRARKLEEGNKAAADRMRKALSELYSDDPKAQAILRGE